MEPTAPKAVFLSYASQDTDAARRIAEALRAEGIEVWFDVSELRGGESWDASIQKQIAECSVFVAIISANTQSRREGYFRLEWRLADERMRLMVEGTPFVLPVIIDGTKERDALVPKSFLGVQWTWLPHGEVPPAFVARVQKLLGIGSAAVDVSVGTQVASAPEKPSALPRLAEPEMRQDRREGFRLRWTALLPWALCAGLAIGLIWRGPRSENAPAGAVSSKRLSIPMPAEVSIRTSNTPTLAISRDGTRLAYVTSRGLETRSMDSFESRVIDPKFAITPCFSPDGRWIAYGGEGGICKVPPDGSSDRVRIFDEWVYYLTWGDDGAIYFTRDIGASGIWAVAADGTGLKQVTVPDPAQKKPFHMSPEYLPGGTLLYTATPHGGWGDRVTLMAQDLASNRPPRVVLEGASSARFVAPGHLVYLDATGNVVIRRFDPRTATVAGEPVAIDQIRSTHWGAAAHVAASREGTLVYIPGTERGKQVLVERDETGRLLRQLHAGNQFRPALSPVRPLLMFSDFDGRSGQIRKIDLNDPHLSAVRVSFEDTLNECTVWSPDGTRLIYGRQTPSGGREVIMHTLDGGKETQLFAENAQTFPVAWSPDGTWVVYEDVESGKPSLKMRNVSDRSASSVLIAKGASYADLSRDGQWLAYGVEESDGPRLYVVSFPDLKSKHQVVPGPAHAPRFSADGLSLYYVDCMEWVHRMGMLHIARRASTSSTTWTKEKALFPAFGHTFVVMENPTRFILVEVDETKLAREIRVVTGWRGDGSGGTARSRNRL